VPHYRYTYPACVPVPPPQATPLVMQFGGWCLVHTRNRNIPALHPAMAHSEPRSLLLRHVAQDTGRHHVDAAALLVHGGLDGRRSSTADGSHPFVAVSAMLRPRTELYLALTVVAAALLTQPSF
jgi:hypothetical protein